MKTLLILWLIIPVVALAQPSLSIKELRVGMTRDEWNSVVERTPWRLIPPQPGTNAASPNWPIVKLGFEPDASDTTFRLIGCAESACFRIDQAAGLFWEGRLKQLELYSETGRDEQYMRSYAEAALQSLLQMFGKPSTEVDALERADFSQANAGKPLPLAIWRRDESVAVLALSEGSDGRHIALTVSNVPAFVRQYSK